MGSVRIYTQQPLQVGNKIGLESGPCRHLIQVLRLRPGGTFSLFNGDGHDYRVKLIATDRKDCQVQILTQGPTEPPPPFEIELAIGISRGERMDFALQKAVELGVTRIQPLVTERTQGRLSKERMDKRHPHWQQIVWSACEQSGRRLLPQLEPSRELENYLERSEHDGVSLLLHPDASASLIDLAIPQKSIRLLSGPEGGFTKSEVERVLSMGFQGIRLGQRILRTETAPLAALAAIQTLWGDFRNL